MDTLVNWFSTDHVLAIANVVLALVAVWTIKSSTRVMAAADRQTEASNGTLLASIRPIVMDVPHSFRDEETNDRDAGQEVHFRDESDGGITVSVPIRNIGPGPAFFQPGAFLRIGSGIETRAEPLHTVLSSGETTLVVAIVRPDNPDCEAVRARPQLFEIGIKYANVAGSERTQSVIRVGKVPRDDGTVYHLVAWVGLFHCSPEWDPQRQPFVSTGSLD